MSQDNHDRYESPLVARNASEAMVRLWSPQFKFHTWRRIWLALAEGQKDLGLPITDQQVQQMREHLEDIDFAKAAEYEKRLRHDVMAHIHTFGDAAPAAKPIIHLGATSATVGDNADLVIMREGLKLVLSWLVNVVDALGTFATKWKDLPCLSYTHFQPAQVTTVGKRATLWCWDFVRDLQVVESVIDNMHFRGIKGTTGTQASFLDLFEQDAEKVDQLEALVAQKMGFEKIEPVTGQTYTRKTDIQVVNALAQVAVSAHKMCNDIRLLSGVGELSEPFETDQVGSSAMPYKRNPMRSERATGLARFVISLASSPLLTAAEQWLERTLDDSSNRRLVLPEAFLATDGILKILTNVANGLNVWPEMVKARLDQELPFMASEVILMAAVKAGGNRQDLHEGIRKHSLAAMEQVKKFNRPNDFLARIKADGAFAAVSNLDQLVHPSRFVGLAPRQTERFVAQYVEPVRRKYAKELGRKAELNV
jgi:adenylosuccinate lyase